MVQPLVSAAALNLSCLYHTKPATSECRTKSLQKLSLWNASQSANDTHTTTKEMDRTWARAEKLVNQPGEFSLYLDILCQGERIKGLKEDQLKWPGALKPVRKYQERILYPKKQGIHGIYPQHPQRSAHYPRCSAL